MAVDLSRLRAVFLDELEDRHRTLQDGLLELERDPHAADRLLPELFRAAHSLKGGAHAVRLPEVATLCHHLEESLSGLRDGGKRLTADLLRTLLADVDELARHAQQLGSRHDAALSSRSRADDRAQADAGHSEAVENPARAARYPPTTSVRVSPQRLDAALERAGDVLLARDRLVELARDAQQLAEATLAADRRWREVRSELGTGLAPRSAAAVSAAERAWQAMNQRVELVRSGAAATVRALEEAAGELEHSTRTLRLEPFRFACDGLERAVRDLTSGPASGKQVRLVLEHGDVELDAEIVAALRDPLLHLVRNAVAHGIEPVARRRQVGKRQAGEVIVSARLLGDEVEVNVRDDGAGLDLAALREVAAAHGVEVDDSDDAAARLAWSPGMSTATTTDELAGRGVGLDAVRGRVEHLGGTVALASTPGQGCTVTLHLPVTVTTLHVLTVEVDDEVVALPSAAIRKVVRIPTKEITQVGGSAHAMLDDALLQVVPLRTFLGLDAPPAREYHLAVIVTGANQPAALIVDRINDARRITRRAAHPRLHGAPGLIGTTVLPSGHVAMVLNPIACVAEGLTVPFAVADQPPAATDDRPPRVLLIEDAATTRALEQDILERAGYEVDVATDGSDGWQRLTDRGADLVVSDVEMPGMDGFALCRAIRDHPLFNAIPVVLVTSRASDEDRHRGVEAGANAYLVKGAFDQAAFLATIGRLL